MKGLPSEGCSPHWASEAIQVSEGEGGREDEDAAEGCEGEAEAEAEGVHAKGRYGGACDGIDERVKCRD